MRVASNLSDYYSSDFCYNEYVILGYKTLRWKNLTLSFREITVNKLGLFTLFYLSFIAKSRAEFITTATEPVL